MMAGQQPKGTDMDYNEEFLTAYVECAFWSSLDYSDESDDNPRPLDEEYSADDLDGAALDEIRADCVAFIEANADDLDAWETVGFGAESAGCDFWLTRNGHGAGFWDRDYSEPGASIGRRLTDAAHVYGSSDLYVGDDGKVYVS